MSTLIVSHDLHIMMLELAVEKLYVPRTNVFDTAILKKTTVMFRLLDDEWTALCPQRSDYRQYRGSNYESEPFHGGKSIVFSLPEASLQNPMENVHLQMHISKDVSRYFEMHPSQNVGFVIVTLDNLFNGIINELDDRKDLAPFLHFHEREPISRSMKGAFAVLDENSADSGSHIELYIRLSYFGKSIITEIATPSTMTKAFYAREETNEKYPYQCRELKAEEIEADCWGSVTAIPPMKPQNLQCDRQTQRNEELVEPNTHHMSDDKMGNNLNRTIGQRSEREIGDKMQNKRRNDADVSAKEDKQRKGKKGLRSKVENNEEAEKTGKERKSEKIDKTETGKSEKTGKTDPANKRDTKTASKEKSAQKEKIAPKEKSDTKEKTIPKEKPDEEKNDMRRKTVKTEKSAKMDRMDKSGKIDEKEKSDKAGKKAKADKTNEKEKVEEKVNKKRRNETNNKEVAKPGERVETHRNVRKKYARNEREIRDNEDERKEKLKHRKESIEPDRIKMLRRRNAGPITVGIFEKNIPRCLQITPQCSCIDCNSSIFRPLSCPAENTFSLAPCPEEQSGNNPILFCC